jgi:4-amino-4-deoxy-L-arabinose transferase-like glycosyltransferase
MFPAGFTIVMTIGFLIRLYACWATFIIPPDGALYLYQAKMIVNGHWDKITGCGLGYLSNYPLFIAGAYAVFHDWVIAGQFVSLFCGTATLAFVYLTVREFFDDQISSIATLIVAMTPVMVSRSADVVRGPVFWVFLSAGIYLFVIGLKRERFAVCLVGSQLAFLMATWARIEGIIVLPVSFIYLALDGGTDRIRRCICFSAPLLLLAGTLLVLSIASGKDISAYYRSGEMATKATSFFQSYGALREQLKASINPDNPIPLRWFLPEARSNVWLVAAGVLVNRICEGFFYPYLLVYMVGLYGVKRRWKGDSRLTYLLWLSVSVLVLLYLHTLQTWMLYYRFVIFAIIPSAVIAALGADTIRERLSSKTKLKPKTILLGLGILIILAGLPKNLKLRDPDKKVFRDIGRQVAAVETDPRGARISTSPGLHRWISFYANMNVSDPPCPQADAGNLWLSSHGDLKKLIRQLQRRGIGYFLWEENAWPGQDFDLDSAIVKEHLQLIGRWQHQDTGKLALFKLRANQL